MEQRQCPQTEGVFVRGAEVPAEKISAVEAGEIAGLVTIKTLFASDKVVMLESFREAGVSDPPHSHSDHQTVCYLKSGRLRVHIGSDSFIAEPGDCWFHPKDVEHYADALADSVQIEVKVPPIKTWRG